MRKIISFLSVLALLGFVVFPAFVEWHFSKGKSQQVEYDFIGGGHSAGFLDSQGRLKLKLAECVDLLEVEVESNYISYLLRPTLEISTSEEEIKFYFQYGVKGRQYLPLASDGSFCADSLQISTSLGIELKASVKSYTFDIDKPVNILVLAPHPDDAEIAAQALYAGIESTVVTITAGDAGRDLVGSMISDPVEKSRLKGLLRAHDSVVIPMLSGVNPYASVNLGYPTGELKAMQVSPGEIIKSRNSGFVDSSYYRTINVNEKYKVNSEYQWRQLVEDLVQVLEDFKPDVVVTPHPVLDLHLDHALTSVALAEALPRLEASSVKSIYLYSNHSSQGESFPFGANDGYIPLMASVDNKIKYSGIYSYNLGELDKAKKFLALEHMHDLRSYDCRGVIDCSSYLFSAKFRLMNFFDVGSDYYRRAVRPNEVFYVQDTEQFLGLFDE